MISPTLVGERRTIPSMTERQSLDPRAERTRAALKGAVVELLSNTSPESISVSDVVKQAGVNRSSFYVHYSDLHTLFADALEDVAVATGTLGGHSDGNSSGVRGDQLPDAVSAYIRHIYDFSDAYRWALGPGGSPQIVFRLRERFRVSLEQGFAHHMAQHPGADLGFGAQAAFLAGGMIGVMTQWLMSVPLADPDTVASWLWREVRTEFTAAIQRVTGDALSG